MSRRPRASRREPCLRRRSEPGRPRSVLRPLRRGRPQPLLPAPRPAPASRSIFGEDRARLIPPKSFKTVSALIVQASRDYIEASALNGTVSGGGEYARDTVEGGCLLAVI